MEQLINTIRQSSQYIDETKAEMLFEYAISIHEVNSLFNVTGYKSVEDIVSGLIIDSILPFTDFNVPRGTSFLDIGTGSGIPGVVLGIMFDGFEGTLVDANEKKVEFINSIIDRFGLNNINAVCNRAEDFSKDNREVYDYCFTKAFGPFYYSIEFGLPALKHDGLLYIYSHVNSKTVNPQIIDHAEELGGSIVENSLFPENSIKNSGLMFRKTKETLQKYPRRFAVIKRESKKILDEK